MHRSLAWAALVFYPLAVFAVVFSDPGVTDFFAQRASQSALATFMANYWWFLLFTTVVVHAAGFVAAALRNRLLPLWRRVLWSVAMLFGIPFGVPAYWWLHSERD